MYACSSTEVLDSMARFRALGVWNYTMATLAEHERVLYVGAREALFALDPNDISKQLRPQVTTHTHLSAAGTNDSCDLNPTDSFLCNVPSLCCVAVKFPDSDAVCSGVERGTRLLHDYGNVNQCN